MAARIIASHCRFDAAELHYALRALLLGRHWEGEGPSHVMVLMEKGEMGAGARKEIIAALL